MLRRSFLNLSQNSTRYQITRSTTRHTMKNSFPIASALLLLARSSGASFSLRKRALDDSVEPYFVLSEADLGPPNPDAATGNPMKGLIESPRYTWPPYQSQIPLSLEFYYIGLDEIMFGDPGVVGETRAFDWSVLDESLRDSASRNMHAVWRVILHFPGQPLKVPQYLLDAGIQLLDYDGGVSPDYTDPQLQKALEQVIGRMGDRYDGDKRLAFLQAGLLGFWGEWHTLGNNFLNDDIKNKVVGWYSAAFNKTQMQVRRAFDAAYRAGWGLHDDSFGYSTLDGEANGSISVGWFFWPRVLRAGQGDVWKKAVVGGETRPELQHIIFENSYPARTHHHQDFMECTEVTHATYMFHHQAFKNGGYSGSELANAMHAHARMGYNYWVSEVAARASGAGSTISLAVKLTQIGVAPFYYSLGLSMECQGMSKSTIWGVEELTDSGASKTFEFVNVPATSACLSNIGLSFDSPYLYPGRPMKFAQANGQVTFSIPPVGPQGPPTAPPVAVTPAPVTPPTARPVPPPTTRPVPPPTARPVPPPTTPPSPRPTARPIPQPTARPVPRPTARPVPQPTTPPSPLPTARPVPQPTARPVPQPTARPVPQPIAPPVIVTTRPVPPPVATPVAGPSCSHLDFLGQCTFTGGCRLQYPGATDCANFLGGVCLCGGVHHICGCLSP